jgi:hypothetical protein
MGGAEIGSSESLFQRENVESLDSGKLKGGTVSK